MFAGRSRLGRVLLLLGVVVPLLLQQVQVQARATCKLHLEGFGSAQGIKSAQLFCSGGTITAHAHPVLLGNLTRTFSGVQWSNDGDCAKNNTNCLLTLCGDTSAAFPAAVIRNLNVSTTTGVFLCLTGNSDVLFEGAQFQENAGRPITITTTSRSVKLHVKGSNFTWNKLPWKNLAGGALWLGGGTAVVEYSVFNGNVVMMDGGAIYVANNVSSIDLSSSVFQGNGAAKNGGGVHIEGNGTRVSVQRCVFTNNTAQWGAGLGIFGSSTVVVSLSNFTTNRAQGAGGAMYVDNSVKLNLTRSLLAGNTAEIHGAGIAVWNKSTAYLDMVTVKDNVVQKKGGGLSVGGMVNAIVQNVLFQNNTSGGCCGAVYVYENSSTKIMHTRVILNSAKGSVGGGGIGVWGNASLVVIDANITNNTATYAGGIDVGQNSTVYLAASVISGNTADISGGGMYAAGNSSVLVKECTMADNTATQKDGGAIFSQNMSKVVVAKSVFSGNQASRGGALYNFNNSVQLGACRLSGNTASSSGGAMAGENGTCTLDACMLEANGAGYGGGIWVTHAKHVGLHHCVFGNNAANNYGGGLNVGGTSNVTMSSCRLVNNTAMQYGGALSATGSASVTMVGDTKGFNNSGNNGGFASLDTSARLQVTGGFFQGNSANGRGGLMYAYNRAAVVLKLCHIYGRPFQERVYGGAFNLDGNATLKLFSSTISGLHADRGGVIAAFSNSSFQAQNCTVSDCTALSDGGGVSSFSASNHSWLGGSFRHMFAKEGAAMFISRGTIHVSGTAFENGTADDGGGALLAASTARVTLHQCNIHGCYASNSGGGGVLVKGDAEVVMLHTNISDCSARHGGGAISGHENATLRLQSCLLQLNKGGLCGGAVHIESTSRLTASNCSIVDNVCNAMGGGFCAIMNASSIFQECVISRNVANRGGGGWLGTNATLGLHSTRIYNNTAFSFGGGVMLSGGRFSLAELRASVQNNKAPIVGKDVTAIPTTITNLNNNTIEGFVSRLGTDAGLLDVTFRITGVQGLPAESGVVHAILDGLVVAKNNSGHDGLLTMHVKLRKPPGTYQVKFTIPGTDDPPSTNITVHVVDCGVGDVTSLTGDACQTCENGYFSLDPRNNTCDICVPNAECIGGASITPAADFWHSAPHSVQMHRCLNSEACPGRMNASPLESGDHYGRDFKSSQCATGYMGNLCGQCDVQSGYGTVKPFTCKQCMKPVVTIVLYSVAALVMLVAVRVMSALALTDSGIVANAPRPSDLVKPLVLYAQYLFIITTINGVPWPRPISVVVQALGFFWSSTASNSLGLDCLLRNTAALPVAIQKTLFSLLMPLAMLLVLLLMDVLWSLRLRTQRRTRAPRQSVNAQDRFASLCVCVFFLFLPTWLHATFSLYTCVALDIPASFPYEAEAVGSYLAADMSERCYKAGGYHRAWALGLGIPMLLLFCLMVPIGLFVFIWLSRKRGKLRDDHFRKHFGFLYRTWREDVCWWEAVTCCQTICLVAIGTFGHVLGVYFQSLVLTAALGIICVLLLMVRPHTSQVAGSVTLFSVWVLITTAFSALTFLSYHNVTPAYGYTMAMGVFVLVINIVFVISTLWRLLRLVEWGVVGRMCGCCGSIAPCCSGLNRPWRRLYRRACSWLDVVRLPITDVSMVSTTSGRHPFKAGRRGSVPPVESVPGSGGS